MREIITRRPYSMIRNWMWELCRYTDDEGQTIETIHTGVNNGRASVQHVTINGVKLKIYMVVVEDNNESITIA